jgi:hypothetical protein
MAQTYDFYDARARDAANEAQAAALDMVRERALRAEGVWRALADQARKVEVDRAKAERERTERRAAEAELASHAVGI